METDACRRAKPGKKQTHEQKSTKHRKVRRDDRQGPVEGSRMSTVESRLKIKHAAPGP